MFQLVSFAIGITVGAVIAFIGRHRQPLWRRRVLPLSVASAGPELVAALSLAVVERHPGLHHQAAYATVSVFERNSPDSTVHIYPARGPRLGSIRLDSGGPGLTGDRPARLLSDMNLPCGVMVIPLATT
ncbi:hypothetical protein ACFV3R_10080 [Streptomyces sp. NPDC059740]|uniref:hypothetical protein n=1 Tax=Streptomyces sp. NPDC059740 TaxID=3346926 RepID=UPI00365F1572